MGLRKDKSKNKYTEWIGRNKGQFEEGHAEAQAGSYRNLDQVILIKMEKKNIGGKILSLSN